MKELLLGLYLAGDELDIVHQQDIRLPVLFPELRVAVSRMEAISSLVKSSPFT